MYSTTKPQSIPNGNEMQTHKYIHISHNMTLHKFEWPAKVLIIDKGKYRVLEYIYVNM